LYRLGSAVIAIATLALTSSASAATFTVNDTSDAPLATPSGTTCVSTHAGSCTLRAAVQAADNAGGTNAITLPSGHLKLTVAPTGATAGSDANDPAHGDLDVLNGNALTITGAGGSSTTVDANEIDRAFAVQHGGSLTLAKLAVENGAPAAQSSGNDNGAGIYVNGALALSGDVSLHDNSTFNTGAGGAIYADNGTTSFSVSGATFAANSAASGGAIKFNTALTTLPVSGSTFSANEAVDGDGGAIDDEGAMAFTVTNSTFSDNGATPNNGGAIFDNALAALTVSSSGFDHNTADRGSAIYDNESTSATIGSTTITDNVATTSAAVYIDDGGSTTNTFTADELDGNRAGQAGGAIRLEGGKLAISASSFVGNHANSLGGGIDVDSGDGVTLTNTTISGNHALEGGGVALNAAAPVSFTNVTIAFNSAETGGGGGVGGANTATTGGTGVVNTLIGDNAGGDCGFGVVTQFHATVDSGNNLDSDGTCFGGLGVSSDKPSVDPLASTAAANGGPVKTDALSTGSPAINAAKAGACPGTDARGVSRPQGAGCDIGAFEESLPIAAITSPSSGATFTQGAVVKAAYTCVEAGLTSLIASCSGPVTSGSPIDTKSPGSHTFSVTAIDDQGQVVATAVQYTVKLPPPPNTKITHHHVSGDTVTLTFKGTGGSGARHFMCRIGGRSSKFKRCASPKSYTHLSKGRHTIAVKAVDSIGQADPSPAILRVRIR
jgi:hypothetical protein